MENILEDLEILILQNEDDFDRGKGVIILREFIKEQKDKLRLNGVGVSLREIKETALIALEKTKLPKTPKTAERELELGRRAFINFIEEIKTGLWIPEKGNILTNNPLLAYQSSDKNKMIVFVALEKLKGFEITEHEFV